jgi:hypothetical protein
MFPYNLFEFNWLSKIREGLGYSSKKEITKESKDQREKHSIESNCVTFDDESYKD